MVRRYQHWCSIYWCSLPSSPVTLSNHCNYFTSGFPFFGFPLQIFQKIAQTSSWLLWKPLRYSFWLSWLPISLLAPSCFTVTCMNPTARLLPLVLGGYWLVVTASYSFPLLFWVYHTRGADNTWLVASAALEMVWFFSHVMCSSALGCSVTFSVDISFMLHVSGHSKIISWGPVCIWKHVECLGFRDE